MAGSVIHTGFTQYRHQLDHKVSKIGIEQVYEAVQKSLQTYDRERANMFDRFVDPQVATDVYQFKHRLDSGIRYQPMGWDSDLRPQVKTGFYDVALPYRMAGTAKEFNRQTRATITVQEMNDWADSVMIADIDWRRHNVISSLLYKSTWTFTDKNDPSKPDLTVYPLANGDSTRTYVLRNASDPATHNHYIGQANAIADGSDNPFPSLFDHLYEHPENNLDQSGFVITYVASNLVASIENLSTIKDVTDDLIIPGISSDRVSNDILNYVGVGDKVVGYVDNNIIVRWSALPSNYGVAIAPDAMSPLRRRELIEDEHRGMVVELENRPPAHQKITQWRAEGYGVQNPVSATCLYIGNATYANPSGYDPSSDAG